ncbi:MAG TPA: DUF3048 domain-containing protein [Candidatus Limnocylindrales bacterium]|nr:DUF3048 domain-containing protein [Candidatus Limnocylindrales bacterium]
MTSTPVRPPSRLGAFTIVSVVVVVLAVLAAWQVAPLLSSNAVASVPPTGAAAPTTGATAPTPSPSPTPAPPTPEPTPPTVPSALTGLPISPESALYHPIAVMVDDHVDARPQSGFNSAAIVWQAPAEGGVPRYMLIFQDTIPASVGPVRSTREYFIEWAAEWHAMYVHHGGSPQALATLFAKGHGQWVWNADGFRWSPKYLWRVTTRRAPHNVYTDGEHLRALAARLDVPDEPITPVWHFAPDADPSLRPTGGTIKVVYPYESVTYRYDNVTNRYVRYINGSKTPQEDADDNSIVAPANVVILRMHFGPLNDGHPNKFRLEADDIGHGDAWISSNGVTIHGTWRKASATAPTLLFGPDGKPVTLTAGQTFVQVLPLSYGYTINPGTMPGAPTAAPSGSPQATSNPS